MQSHELLKEVLRKTSAKQVASEMGLSLSLIYKWAEPPDDGAASGANNPLDRVGQLSAAIARKEADIAAIRREIQKLPPAPVLPL